MIDFEHEEWLENQKKKSGHKISPSKPPKDTPHKKAHRPDDDVEWLGNHGGERDI